MNKINQYRKTSQIPRDITIIDRIYQVQYIFSQHGNSQGIVLLVNKKQKLLAAKIFRNLQSYERQIKYMVKLNKYQFIPKLEYYNPSAEIIRRKSQIQYLPLIIMEFCQYGDLFDFIQQLRKANQNISIGIVIGLFKQLLQELKIIHQNGILHRDIKIQNILLDKNFTIKICDFGLSTSIDQKILKKDQIAGTIGMRPPQSFLYLNQQKQRYYGPESEIFCCGIILFNLLFFKKLPVEQQQRQKLNHYYQNYFAKKQSHEKLDQFWRICGITQVPIQIENLLRDILVIDYKQRLKIDEILGRDIFIQRQNNEKIKEQLQSIVMKLKPKRYQKIKKIINKLEKKKVKNIITVNKVEIFGFQLFNQEFVFRGHKESPIKHRQKYLQKQENIFDHRVGFKSQPVFIRKWIQDYLKTYIILDSNKTFNFLIGEQIQSYSVQLNRIQDKIICTFTFKSIVDNYKYNIEITGKIKYEQVNNRYTISWSCKNINVYIQKVITEIIMQSLVALISFQQNNVKL